MKLFHTLFLALFLLFSSSAFAANTSTDKVNVNTANAEQIASAMNGIGTSKAQAIVKYRSTHGKFKSINELENVDGIGAKTLEKNKNTIRL